MGKELGHISLEDYDSETDPDRDYASLDWAVLDSVQLRRLADDLNSIAESMERKTLDS